MAAAVSAKLVKELRDKTGAGMMDCKKALAATEGDANKAVEWLRQKGIASAEKKSGRTAAEGAIGSYIHTGARVGVLVEVNCETDFVARGDMFQSLLRDVSMQVAACPNVEYVTTDEIPDEIREREKAIEMGRDDLEGKPEQMKEKIVEGRIGKRLKELALMEQPFIKDSSITVADLVKQTAGKIGENVKVTSLHPLHPGRGRSRWKRTISLLKWRPCRTPADSLVRPGRQACLRPVRTAGTPSTVVPAAGHRPVQGAGSISSGAAGTAGRSHPSGPVQSSR